MTAAPRGKTDVRVIYKVALGPWGKAEAYAIKVGLAEPEPPPSPPVGPSVRGRKNSAPPSSDG